MKRAFESGYQKRKRKQQLEDELKEMPKLDKYFTQQTEDDPQTKGEHAEHPIPSFQTQQQAIVSHTEIVETVESGISADGNIGTDPGVSGTAVGELTSIVESTKFTKLSDIGQWGVLTEDELSYWIFKGPSECQHWNSSFENSKRSFKNQVRYCSKGLFQNRKVNGEVYDREWLVYSPTTGSIYCFVCKLFSSSTTALASDGFSDWRNPIAIQNHETSEDHRTALLTYLTRKRGSTLDSALEKQIKEEQLYWRNVLKRVVAVVCLLAERGLAFRGENETFESTNNGNYLGLLELIAKFDPFLSNHIKQHGNRGSGSPSYLSKTVCDEFIQLMANRVRNSILDDLRKAGYFSLSVDSTPDLSNVDQLTVIVRYVSPDDGLPVERFLNFIPLENHSGASLAGVVVDYLTKECKVDFTKCRGQSYDNAANMAGKYNGMQQKIIELNKHAIFIPCAGHSLNLVGRAAVDCCLDAVNFFAVVQELYTFFSSSTKRWSVMLSFLKTDSDNKVLKSLSDTRWEANFRAVAAIKMSYQPMLDALTQIYDDENEKGATRLEAGSLLEKMEELEFVFMLHLWNNLLQEFHKTSMALQDSKIALTTCAHLYKSLSRYVKNIREKFDDIEEEVKSTLPGVEYKSTVKRKRVRRKQANDGAAPDADEQLSAREKFRVKSFTAIIDILDANLTRRATIYNSVANKFSCLVDLEISEVQLRQAIDTLIKEYPHDVDINLMNELRHFHDYVKQNYSEKECFQHKDLYQIIFQDKIELVFPNVEAILRLFMCLMVTNCSGERSFSQLKRIKNELRATMSQEKLSALSIMCIESDKLRSISFDDLINDFAFGKSRKKLL